MRTTGNDQEEVLLEAGAEYMNPTDWSKDGRFIIYFQLGSGTQQGDLWVLPLTVSAAEKYLATPFSEYWGRLSPDGRWMAYVSNETGSDEVYVQSFPEPGRRVRVSNGGGSHPRWRGDGREIFYLAPDKRLMALAVKGENAFEASGPSHSSRRRVLIGIYRVPLCGDGRWSALFSYQACETSATSLTVVLNWTAELKR